MKDLSDILTFSTKDGINLWIFDTTSSNLMRCERNQKLIDEIENWEKYKIFADKYGLVLTHLIEDYVSIFILSQLLKHFKLICHPDEQDENSTLNRLSLKTNEVNWIVKTCIYYDMEYNYKVEGEEFEDSGYFPPFKWSDFEKVVKGNLLSRAFNKVKFVLQQSSGHESKSKVYELIKPNHVHQAVICGGYSDVYKCPNYIGIKSETQRNTAIKLLSSKKKPTIDKALDEVEFYAIDFKGEDMGYARHLKIYSKRDMSQIILELTTNFKSFIKEYEAINLECENLNQYELKMNELVNKYGC